MSDENKIVDDPAVAANNDPPVEAATTPISEATPPPAADATAPEVGTAEAAPQTEAPAGVETEAAGDSAPTVETEAPPVETQSSVEEIADIEPVVNQRLTIERAQSAPIDERDGMTLRTAYVLQDMTDAAKPITGLMITARKINSDGRLDMVTDLLMRLRNHAKSYQPAMMAEAIGDVTVGDELERFAREGIEFDELVAFCADALPAVNAIP